jgi:hypothetical protein
VATCFSRISDLTERDQAVQIGIIHGPRETVLEQGHYSAANGAEFDAREFIERLPAAPTLGQVLDLHAEGFVLMSEYPDVQVTVSLNIWCLPGTFKSGRAVNGVSPVNVLFHAGNVLFHAGTDVSRGYQLPSQAVRPRPALVNTD